MGIDLSGFGNPGLIPPGQVTITQGSNGQSTYGYTDATGQTRTLNTVYGDLKPIIDQIDYSNKDSVDAAAAQINKLIPGGDANAIAMELMAYHQDGIHITDESSFFQMLISSQAYVPPPGDAGALSEPQGGNPCMGGLVNVAMFTAILDYMQMLKGARAEQGIVMVQQQANAYAATDAQAAAAKDIYDKQAQEKRTEGIGQAMQAVVNAGEAAFMGYSMKSASDQAGKQKVELEKQVNDIETRQTEYSLQTGNKNPLAGEKPGSGPVPKEEDLVYKTKADALDDAAKKKGIETQISGLQLSASQAASGNAQLASAVGGTINGGVQAYVDFTVANLKGQEGTDEYQRIEKEQEATAAAKAYDTASKAMQDMASDGSKALQLLDKSSDASAHIGPS